MSQRYRTFYEGPLYVAHREMDCRLTRLIMPSGNHKLSPLYRHDRIAPTYLGPLLDCSFQLL